MSFSFSASPKQRETSDKVYIVTWLLYSSMQTNQCLDAIEKSIAKIMQTYNWQEKCDEDGDQGLILLWVGPIDIMFTPEELSRFLVYELNPRKSTKKGLDKVKVTCIFSFSTTAA